jgi:hypothetical protein
VNVWQHKSTINAPATKAQRARIDALVKALGRKQATLHIGPCDTPGAYAIGITFDSQSFASRVNRDEQCGILFHDGYIVWGSRDDLLREKPLVDKWAQHIGVHVAPEYETVQWSREAAAA